MCLSRDQHVLAKNGKCLQSSYERSFSLYHSDVTMLILISTIDPLKDG